MPEGDTIHRAAASLHQALAGRTLIRFKAPRLAHRPFPPGTVVVGAEARGKHCLVHFDDGRSLHTHMRMTGSWHLYRPGERWRKKAAAARVVLEVAPDGDRTGWVAVCFAAPVVELVATDDDGRAGNDPTAHLGPDLVRQGADIDEALARLARYSAAEREIGDALLDQRIANGVGNVYKCEVLFACGLDPFTPVGDVPRPAAPQAAGDGPSPAPGQPVLGRPGHRGGRPRRLRPPRPAVPALRHPRRLATAGRPGERHLLVPDLPATTVTAGSASWRSGGSRWRELALASPGADLAR